MRALAACALALACRSPSPAPSDQNPKAPPMSNPTTAASLALGSVTQLPWDRLPAKVVDVGPPTGSAFELPGPRTRPVRPHLELASSPAGLAARLVQGDGAVAPLAVLGAEVVALPAAPLALSARRDGVWALYRDKLVHHDRTGAVRHEVPRTGIALLGAEADAAWLVTNDAAWHIAADGAARGPYPWPGGLVSFAHRAQLCARDKRDDRALACLSPDGASSAPPLPASLEPLEQPLELDGDRLTTLQGATLRLRKGADILATWTFQAAGLDAAGHAFAVTAEPEQLTLWRGSPDRQLPSRTFPRVGPGSLSAASVAGDDVTLYSQGRASVHRASASEQLTIDEAAYRAQIFPSAWSLSPSRGIAASTGGFTLAATGPTGVALIELRR